jgi:hypothetical protein
MFGKLLILVIKFLETDVKIHSSPTLSSSNSCKLFHGIHMNEMKVLGLFHLGSCYFLKSKHFFA